MKFFPFIALCAILVCFQNIYSQNAAPESDIQFWNETQLTFPLIKKKDSKGKETDKVSFFLVGNLRIGQNARQFVDERIGFGFDIKINNNVSLTPAYIYQASQPFKNRREFESRFRFAVTVEKRFKNFSLKDRNLIEYRMRNSRADSTRYRNRFTFAFPVRKDKKEIFTPFIYDEIFYDISQKEFNRNEISAGITRKINKNLTTDFFYLLRKNKGGAQKTLNAFGINLKIRID